MKHYRGLVVALVLTFTIQSKAQLSCQYVRPILDTMLGQHLVYNQFNSTLQDRTTEQYLKTLDSGKMYFLKADMDQVKTLLQDMYAKLAHRDCGALEKVNEMYLKRVEERTKFADKYLGKEFKLNKEGKIDLDTDKRVWAKTSEELDKYETDYIQFQVASLMATDMTFKEARDQVKRRYERAEKNLKDEKTETLYDNYLDAGARALDPHSSYLSRENLEDFEIQMRLSLEGIGATLSSQDGYTVIEQLVKGGAAEKSGQLLTQDKIIAVGQGPKGKAESVIDMPLKDVVRLIRGKKGTQVRLSVLRKEGGKAKHFSVTLSRDKINLEEEAAKIYYVDRKVDGKQLKFGVIDLPSFYADTKRGGRSAAKDVKKLLLEAQTKKVDGMILDLSSNGGGSLEDAVALAGLFFKTGNVVATQGNHGSVDMLADDDADVEYNGPLILLTSRLSASASEIVSGALKDYKRAIIVGGDHTFGKGTVQSVVPLPNNLGAIKVTVGMFFVPGGETTQHQGVAGDVVLPGAFARDDIGEKSLDYSLQPRQIKPFLSDSAYVKSGPGAWIPVSQSLADELKKNSEKRVSSSDEFKKIKTELQKNIQKGKVVTIAEILEKKDETKANEEKRKARAKSEKLRAEEYLKRPEVQEGLNVLSEMVTIEQKQGVIVTGTTAPADKKD